MDYWFENMWCALLIREELGLNELVMFKIGQLVTPK